MFKQGPAWDAQLPLQFPHFSLEVLPELFQWSNSAMLSDSKQMRLCDPSVKRPVWVKRTRHFKQKWGFRIQRCKGHLCKRCYFTHSRALPRQVWLEHGCPRLTAAAKQQTSHLVLLILDSDSYLDRLQAWREVSVTNNRYSEVWLLFECWWHFWCIISTVKWKLVSTGHVFPVSACFRSTKLVSQLPSGAMVDTNTWW